MIDFSQMLTRLVVAMVLGALIGLERERVGKEVGVRTAMTVSAGAALFSIAGLMLPYIAATSADNLSEVIARNGGFLNVIANIVVGIGFLGAGIIIKNEDRVHGLTSAAIVWLTAAVGVLAGIGLIEFATVTTLIVVTTLYVLRKLNVAEKVRGTVSKSG